MAQRDLSRPQFDVPSALLVVGVLGLITGIATIAASTLAYAASRDFSFVTTYISDFGAAEGWPSTLYSVGMLRSTRVHRGWPQAGPPRADGVETPAGGLACSRT